MSICNSHLRVTSYSYLKARVMHLHLYTNSSIIIKEEGKSSNMEEVLATSRRYLNLVISWWLRTKCQLLAPCSMMWTRAVATVVRMTIHMMTNLVLGGRTLTLTQAATNILSTVAHTHPHSKWRRRCHSKRKAPSIKARWVASQSLTLITLCLWGSLRSPVKMETSKVGDPPCSNRIMETKTLTSSRIRPLEVLLSTNSISQ